MKRSLLIILVCTTIALGTSPAGARDTRLGTAMLAANTSPWPAWTTVEDLANTSTLSRAPDIVVTPSGTAHVVWEEEEGSIYHTSDSSGSWSVPAEAAVGDSPSLAVDGNGVVHMAYISDIGGVFDVFYTRWDGTDWSLPVNVSGTSGSVTSPAMAVAPDNTLHIVWADTTGGTAALYHGQSPDGSAWSTSPILNGTGSAPAVIIGDDGVLHVAWQRTDTDTGFDEIWYVQFSGGSWSPPENISNTANEDSTVPAIAVGPEDTIHVVWAEALGVNTAIYYASGQQGIWTLPEDVSGTLESAEFPTLDIDAVGNGFLAWDEGGDIMGRGLDAVTGTWSAREQVASDVFGIADPALVLDSSQVHAVWAEEVSDFNWDIFYSTQAACVLAADVDGDNDIDVNDVTDVVTQWRTSGFDAKYDLDKDGRISIIDVMLVASQWGACK